MRVILDTNLLVLLVVGAASEDYIHIHKKLDSYTIDDYRLLLKILSGASDVVVTPNTLSETSNLVGYIGEPARSKIYAVFRKFVGSPETKEVYVKSDVAASRVEFVRLGLADSAMLEISNATDSLPTADLDLYLSAPARGAKAENFNHYRDL